MIVKERYMIEDDLDTEHSILQAKLAKGAHQPMKAGGGLGGLIIEAPAPSYQPRSDISQSRAGIKVTSAV
jgi:hypothetical protein